MAPSMCSFFVELFKSSARLTDDKTPFEMIYLKKGGIVMSKKFTSGIALSVLIMFGLPLLSLQLAEDTGGFLVILLMFFVLYPLWSAFTGIFAATDIKRLWPLPVISALLSLSGSWIFFEMGESAFLFLAIIYLLISIVFMGITYFILRKKQKSADKATF